MHEAWARTALLGGTCGSCSEGKKVYPSMEGKERGPEAARINFGNDRSIVSTPLLHPPEDLHTPVHRPKYFIMAVHHGEDSKSEISILNLAQEYIMLLPELLWNGEG